MKLVSFLHRGDGEPRAGLLDDSGVYDLREADPEIPADVLGLIAAGPAWTRRAVRVAAEASATPLEQITLLAPIPRPRKNILCVGRNYRDHAAEFSGSGFDASEKQMLPDHPVIFTKPATSVIGPETAICSANDPTGTVDYEGELAVVIGRDGRGISADDALQHVYGYTIINDVTARDLQKRHVQWFVGKSPDTFCPMGPCIVTADELPDVTASWLRTWVNGELRQEAQIAQLIFDIPTLIATLSQSMTLEAGDVIATGTPSGAGLGFDPPRFLHHGDVVKISIDGIGTLSNPVS